MESLIGRLEKLDYNKQLHSTKELYLNLIIKKINYNMDHIIYQLFLNQFKLQDIKIIIERMNQCSKKLQFYKESIYTKNDLEYIIQNINEDKSYNIARETIIYNYKIQEVQIPERRPDEFNFYNFMNTEWIIDYLYHNQNKTLSLIS